ncbi:MAG: hypothetical protein HY909_02440 [Deltaproteobacteria bacterium]|nr:hypothetical protein [Deltaproteobacteria bacterium]
MKALRMLCRALPLVAGAFAYGGCYLPPPDQDRDRDEAPRASARTARPTGLWDPQALVSGAESLRGDLGNIRAFASEDVELRVAPGSGTRPIAQVQLDAVNESQRWWVMTRMTLTGGLSHPSLQPGATLTFTRGSPTAPGALGVNVLGCSGPRRNNYTFDRSADRVDMRVLPGSTPDAVRVEFTATWNAATQPPQVVRGVFEYDPQ